MDELEISKIVDMYDAVAIVEEIVAEVTHTDIPPAIAAGILTDIATLLQTAAIAIASVEEQGHSVN